MTKRMTIGELAVLVEGKHELVMAGQERIGKDIGEIKDTQGQTHDTLVEHAERISRVEGKQGVFSKILFAILGGGSLLGGAGFALSKLM